MKQKSRCSQLHRFRFTMPLVQAPKCVCVHVCVCFYFRKDHKIPLICPPQACVIEALTCAPQCFLIAELIVMPGLIQYFLITM